MGTNDPFQFEEPGKEEEPSDLIENLQKKLYSRKDEIKHQERTVLRPKKFGDAADWEEDLSYRPEGLSPGISPYVKFFVFSLLFFLVAALIAGYSILGRRSFASPENVLLSLNGPVSIKGGDTLSFETVLENKNAVELNSVEIVVEFPDGSRVPNNPGALVPRQVKGIAVVGAKQIRTETFKTVVFGSENARKEARVSVKFRIEGSATEFKHEKILAFTLTDAPVTVKPDLVKDIVSGQEIVVAFNVTSGSASVVKNALLRVEYPKGFSYRRSSPSPVSGDNIWNLGTLKQGDTKRIEIKGVLSGENNQEKVFRVSTGIPGEEDETRIETKFVDLLAGTTIKKPFLGVELFVNGSSDPDYYLKGRDEAIITVVWNNNLPFKITNSRIDMKIEGDLIDPKTVTPGNAGVYDGDTKIVTWDGRGEPTLATIPSGASSAVGVGFQFLSPVRNNVVLYHEPTFTVRVGVKGKRLSENDALEDIESFAERTIKMPTTARFHKKVVYSAGPFINTGPIPPKVGQETTYTITWKVTNTTSAVIGAKIAAILPSYVKWKGEVYPSGENLVFNSVSGEVVWDVGKIKAGAGFQNAPEEVSFQVGITPTISQRSTSPILLSPSVLTGKDEFTDDEINIKMTEFTTLMTEDPKYPNNSGLVGE